jgi:hypothetical protein
MNCDKTEDQLIGYFLNTLKQKERERMGTHFTSCQKCQRRLEELEKVRGLFREWRSVNPPPGLKQRVLDNVRAQKLIEEKTSKETHTEDLSKEKTLEWLKKRVRSEQIRIYKILTDFLGKEKGEEVYDYYLEEEFKEQMSAPPEDLQVMAESLGFDMEIKMLEGGVMKETIRNCSYISMAKELGMKASPCEAICLKYSKLQEKFQSVKAEWIKKMPNKEGECIFLFTPLEQKPSS